MDPHKHLERLIRKETEGYTASAERKTQMEMRIRDLERRMMDLECVVDEQIEGRSDATSIPPYLRNEKPAAKDARG